MPNTSLLTPNILPEVLDRRDAVTSPFLDTTSPSLARALHDLNAAAGGYDFLLQAANVMCAETAFGSLKLHWIAGRLDSQALATLRASSESPSSPALRALVDAPSGAAAGRAPDILILFSRKDVQFDGPAACRVRANIRIALGSLFQLPSVPGLSRTLSPGEAVQRFGVEVARLQEVVRQGQHAARELAQMMGGAELQPLQMMGRADLQPPAANQVSSTMELEWPPGAPLTGEIGADWRSSDLVDQISVNQLMPKRVTLDNDASFDVTAWLGGGVVEVPAPFGASGDQPSATIRVAADVSASTPHYTDLSHDAALLLSSSDPLGLVAETTHRVRERGRVALLDDISLVGGPANVKVQNLSSLAPEAFPCGQGACPLSVGTTIVPWHAGTPVAIRLVGESGYCVLWSKEALELLVRHCWETGHFPRIVPQSVPVPVMVEGHEQEATAELDIKLDTLDTVTLEFDSNGRTDVLYIGGTAQVVPRLIRLVDGRELVPLDPNDPTFAPSPPGWWQAIAVLSEHPTTVPDPGFAQFERAVTVGTTSRLGRPFTEPEGRTVIFSRISAVAQRILLLAE